MSENGDLRLRAISNVDVGRSSRVSGLPVVITSQQHPGNGNIAYDASVGKVKYANGVTWQLITSDINGITVSGTPTTGQVLTYNGTAWTPQTSSSSAVTMGGDVTGSSNNCTVVALQNHPIAAGVPAANTVLAWNGSSWASGNPVIASSQIGAQLYQATQTGVLLPGTYPILFDSTLLAGPYTLASQRYFSYNSGTGVLTATQSGLYQISCTVEFVPVVNTQMIYVVDIIQNGTAVLVSRILVGFPNPSNQAAFVSINGYIRIASGDTLSVSATILGNNGQIGPPFPNDITTQLNLTLAGP